MSPGSGRVLASVSRSHRADVCILDFDFVRYCLQPPGDNPTRKGIFDSLGLGCIPVVFSRHSIGAFTMHIPDPNAISVYIPPAGLLAGTTDIIAVLRTIPASRVKELRSVPAPPLPPASRSHLASVTSTLSHCGHDRSARVLAASAGPKGRQNLNKPPCELTWDSVDVWAGIAMTARCRGSPALAIAFFGSVVHFCH